MKLARKTTIAATLAACAFATAASQEASSLPPQQAPAPIVRPRPRPVTIPGSTAEPTPTTPSARSTTASRTQTTSSPDTLAKPHTATTASTEEPRLATPKPAAPQPLGPGPLNRSTIVIDPAHGGQDTGSRLSDSLVEKDVTLALAFKLRSLLQARGFTVVLTRDSDAATYQGGAISLDDRAGIANHERAAACLLLHATSAGSGVHLYHSDLPPAAGEGTQLNWLNAQGPWVAQSTALASKLSQALAHSGMSVVNSAASVRPVDSLTCPALVLELAPKAGGDPSSLNGDSYQNDVAQALANALVFWKTDVQPPPRVQPATIATASSPATTPAAAPKPKPKPKPPVAPVAAAAPEDNQ